MTNDPASAETEPGAGTAKNEAELETGVQAGTDGSEVKLTLPGDETDETKCTETEQLTDSNAALSAKSGWSVHGGSRRVSGPFGDPIREGDGQLLLDDNQRPVYEAPGWRVKRDQSGMLIFDADQYLCWEPVNEDVLALKTRPATNQVPEDLAKLNHKLQAQLQWSEYVHQQDVEHVEWLYTQQQAQNAADQSAMAAEFEMRQTEFAEERRREREKFQKAMRMGQEEKAASDTKWATWVQQLQTEQALKQGKVAEDYACRFAEQDALYKELQQKMNVSESVAPSNIVYPSQSTPLVMLSVPSQS